MKIQELYHAENVIIQIVWGEKMIEFYTKILERNEEGVYATPYIFGNKPLEINIEASSPVVCNIFGDSPANGKRLAWRNIDLKTVMKDGEPLYFLSTQAFNVLASEEERRSDDRVLIQKTGLVLDGKIEKTTQVLIHDVSNSGISFLAPDTYEPFSSHVELQFMDSVGGYDFNLKVPCTIVRTKTTNGMTLYGCRVKEDNKNYILYGCLCRLQKKQ